MQLELKEKPDERQNRTNIVKGLSLFSIARMTEGEAKQVFLDLKWPKSGGEPVCPECGGVGSYIVKKAKRFRCKACAHDYTAKSGTLFQGAKLSYLQILFSAAVFVGGAKGVAALQAQRYVDVQYKTVFVLFHKFREALQRPGLVLTGDVQIDGCTLGGYFLHASRLTSNGVRHKTRTAKLENRRVVTVIRQADGKATKAFVGKKESESFDWTMMHVDPAAKMHADLGLAWDKLGHFFEMARVNHSKEFVSDDGGSTNMAESFFAMLRKMQYGIHHHITAAHLQAYVNELTWRQDMRGKKESERIVDLLKKCIDHGPSRNWKGYWQRGNNSGVSTDVA